MHTKRHDLQLEISQKNDAIAQLNKKIILCDKSTSKKTVSSSHCTDERALVKVKTSDVAEDKNELGKFKNQYYAVIVWIPCLVAACMILIGRYVGLATLIACINWFFIALSDLTLFTRSGGSGIWVVFLLILLVFLFHGYSLYLVLDEPVQKNNEPPSDE